MKSAPSETQTPAPEAVAPIAPVEAWPVIEPEPVVPDVQTVFEATPVTPALPMAEILPTEPVPSPEPLPSTEPQPDYARIAREWLFGGNLFVKAGLAIMFVGVSFFVRYVTQRHHIPIELRLFGISLGAMALFVWAFRMRLARPSVSLPIQGTSMGILMLVVFAAYRLFDLMPSALAFALLFSLTFFTCALAVLQNAQWLAIFGICAGFLSPVLTSSGNNNYIALFSYYALLNGGILGIALKRSWRGLNVLGFVFTFGIGTLWGVLRYEPENYAGSQFFLALFFCYFLALSILYARHEVFKLRHYVDGTLVFGTPLVAFGLQAGLLKHHALGLAFSSLTLASVYVAVASILWKRSANTFRLLLESFLALAVVFLSLAVPLGLSGRWTSAAWALEGAALCWLGLRQKKTWTLFFGLLLQLGAWGSFASAGSRLDKETALSSHLWLSFLLLAGTALGLSLQFKRNKSFSSRLTSLFLVVAVLLGISGAWTEVWLRTEGMLSSHLGVITVIPFAAGLFFLSRREDWPLARTLGILVQLAAAVLFFPALGQLFGQTQIGFFEGPFLGTTILSFSSLASALFFHRHGDNLKKRELSNPLLGWGLAWWFFASLPSLAAVFYSPAASTNLFVWAWALGVAGSVPFIWAASALFNWSEIRWASFLSMVGLAYAVIHLNIELLAPGLQWPSWLAFVAFAALWAGTEFTLYKFTAEIREFAIFPPLHVARVLGPWLTLWPLSYKLVQISLNIDSVEQADMLAEAGWFTQGTWPGTLSVWVLWAAAGLLMFQGQRNRWPVAPLAALYQDVVWPVVAFGAVFIAFVWNLTENGLMAPLPYVPLLNPLDLTTGFAALLLAYTYSMHRAKLADFIERIRFWSTFLGFVWLNFIFLRTTAYYAGIPYQWGDLVRSPVIQLMWTLLWSSASLVVMVGSAKKKWRQAWLAGATLLSITMLKLFLFELSNVGSLERVVAFITVGLLMLAIGYFAPIPTENSTPEKTQ